MNRRARVTPHVKTSILLLAALALAGCGKRNEFVPPPPVPVTVATPEIRDVTIHTTYPGTLTGVSEVEIRARVRGILEKRYFKAGQLVKKGDPLFLIEQAPYKTAVTEAEGNLAQAVANRDLARANRMRLENAFKTKAVSEIDVIVAKANEAKAEAAVVKSKAALEKALIDFSYTEIKAPIDGRLSRALVDTGNLVGSAEPTLLTTIIDDTKIRAYFEMSERAVLPYLDRRPHPGTGKTKIQTRKDFSVQLVMTNGKVYKHPGKLDFVDNRIDPSTRTIHVRAEFPNPDGELAAGMFAQIGLPIPLPKAVLVPQVAISSDLAGTYVWVVDPGNVVRRNGVETGPSVGENIVATKGLKGDEKVIVAGVQRAREGAKVAPEFAKKEKKAEEKQPEKAAEKK